MSRRVIVIFDSDLDQSKEADCTFTFGDGIDTWELDATKAEREKFEKLLEPYKAAAHKVNSPHILLTTGPDREEEEKKLRRREQAIRIYNWALDQEDLEEDIRHPASRNAVPPNKKAVKDAYFEAHPDEEPV